MILMEFLVDFARTGRLGPLYCGMPLAAAQDLLGPGVPHPAIRMRPDIDGYSYYWGTLDLRITRGHVSGIGIETARPGPDARLRLPGLILPLSPSTASVVYLDDLVAALEAAGCWLRYAPSDPVYQRFLHVEPGDVGASFILEDTGANKRHPPRYYLLCMYRHEAHA